MRTSWTKTAAMIAAIVGFAVPAMAQTQQQVPKDVRHDLEKLHADNQAEITLAQQAMQRAQSQSVKNLASMLERDHRQLDAQLQQMAQQMGVNLDGSTYHKELNKLQGKARNELGGKQGEAFDRAYSTLMVKDHKEDVNNNLPNWIKHARGANLPQLAATLDEVDNTLKTHLQHSQQVQAREQQQAASGTTGTGTAGTGAGSATGTGMGRGDRGMMGGSGQRGMMGGGSDQQQGTMENENGRMMNGGNGGSGMSGSGTMGRGASGTGMGGGTNGTGGMSGSGNGMGGNR